jgi:Starch-binding associating with outer membrane
VNLVQSGRKDFVAANTLVNAMKTLDDPRVPFYFTTDANDDYTGGTYGASNNYATFSKPSLTIQAPNFETLFMDYTEVQFLLAEAVERGYNVPGSAQSHYDAAITASIKYWGGTDNDVATYLAQTDVDYSTAAGTFKQKIGVQKWIALYNRGIEAWTEWRRLDAPVLTAPPNALSAIPVRFRYSDEEQNLNSANYALASTAIGGDLVTTKLFWDVN